MVEVIHSTSLVGQQRDVSSVLKEGGQTDRRALLCPQSTLPSGAAVHVWFSSPVKVYWVSLVLPTVLSWQILRRKHLCVFDEINL